MKPRHVALSGLIRPRGAILFKSQGHRDQSLGIIVNKADLTTDLATSHSRLASCCDLAVTGLVQSVEEHADLAPRL
jgi:hypothetical protein